MDRLVALYKTWDGGEFIGASLASIYESVAAIVMVHSEVSWLGERGNSVVASALMWCEEHDASGKVHHISLDTNVLTQERQYTSGLDYIADYDLGEIVMVVDADEVWEACYIENAQRQMRETPDCPVYRCRMHTYLKSPFFRVMPPTGTPVAFVRDGKCLTQSPRGCRAHGLTLDAWMHHYTYVRETREAVERKLHQSAKADGGESVVSGWMESVYDRLPAGENLHGFVRWRQMWERVVKVWMPDVPEALRGERIMELWMPPGEMNDGERNALHRLARGRGQAVDLGTYHGRSAAALSLACKRCHTVDCYTDLPEGTFADTIDPQRYETWQQGSLAATQALAKRLGNLTCEQSLTADAGRNWNGGPVAVLFVDADHSESAVLQDAFAWLPHMKPGSRVIFHDNNEIHPGVQSAIRSLMASGQFEAVDPGEYAGSIAVLDVR